MSAFGLPELPALPDITGTHSYPTSTSAIATPAVASGSGTLIPASVGGIPSPDVLFPKSGSDSGEEPSVIRSIVFIILGLLFIAAGIFSFREVRQTVVTTAKTAAKAAVVA
jgi:hypothetical protein